MDSRKKSRGTNLQKDGQGLLGRHLFVLNSGVQHQNMLLRNLLTSFAHFLFMEEEYKRRGREEEEQEQRGGGGWGSGGRRSSHREGR